MNKKILFGILVVTAIVLFAVIRALCGCDKAEASVCVDTPAHYGECKNGYGVDPADKSKCRKDIYLDCQNNKELYEGKCCRIFLDLDHDMRIVYNCTNRPTNQVYRDRPFIEAVVCPVPVDCTWIVSGDWSECDQTACGTVCTKTRTRTQIPAKNGGAECTGDAIETMTEDNPACEAEIDCPTECGYAGGEVADGVGGLKTCEATAACAIDDGEEETDNATTTPETEDEPTEKSKIGVSHSGGQFMWQANPRLWIITQIHFVEAKIEALQKELNALLGK